MWLTNSSLGRWVQESDSVLAYPMVITFHTFGLSFLVGTSMAIDFRILGIGRSIPLAPMEKFFPVMWIGFWMNAVSGVLLFIPEATRWALNPIFLIKVGFIALGVLNVWLIKTSVFREAASVEAAAVSLRGKILAGTSLAIWVVAITAGRLTAYADGWRQLRQLFLL